MYVCRKVFRARVSPKILAPLRSFSSLRGCTEDIGSSLIGRVLELVNPYQNIFFTGKGGTGKVRDHSFFAYAYGKKTSLACATSLLVSNKLPTHRVLLVSTDPASNLDEMLGIKLTDKPTQIPSFPNLEAMNIDPQLAANNYREKVLKPYRGVVSEKEFTSMTESLSGACTVEVATFDSFASLLDPRGIGKYYDHIIFDTAPTGHTLRLLQLPRAWTDFLHSNTRGASCLGPHSGLQMYQEEFERAYKNLSDPSKTMISLVARSDLPSLKEAARTSTELKGLNLSNQILFVNGVFRAQNEDKLAKEYERSSLKFLDNLPKNLEALPRVIVPLRSYEMVGRTALVNLLERDDTTINQPAKNSLFKSSGSDLNSLVQELETQKSGLVLITGKGGVGKTTIAAALATELAQRGKSVHLSTTDPAAHIIQTIGDNQIPNLTVSRIDPHLETEKYKKKVMATKGKDLDDEGKAFLAEDLNSPCSEEVAVFHAFSHLVFQSQQDFIILDTAPTGHTLLLLDAAGSYHRDVLRSFKGANAQINIKTPFTILQNPKLTKVIIVSLPQQTPISEAAALQEDLKRANITPFAWIINSTLVNKPTSDPVLLRKIENECSQIDRVKSGLSNHVYFAPWLPEPPIGLHGLHSIFSNDADCTGTTFPHQ